VNLRTGLIVAVIMTLLTLFIVFLISGKFSGAPLEFLTLGWT
jgi:VIT1/CCC1 family predicted Fe2+/Mn2+ transporter